jgi:uncharacterized membrane-anchored protein YitT (DUF2179 family)
MALSVNLIYGVAAWCYGGVAGLAIVIKEWTSGIIDGGVPVWLFTILCNVPLFLIALKTEGIKFLISGAFGTAVYVIG